VSAFEPSQTVLASSARVYMHHAVEWCKGHHPDDPDYDAACRGDCKWVAAWAILNATSPFEGRPVAPQAEAEPVRLLSDAKWVARTPMLTVALLEYANIGQLWRMWREQSALGQNVWSWIAVNAALWLWLNYYRVIVPGGLRSTAARATMVGIALNGAVIATVIYFRARHAP
jgi:hypothetical protein